MKKPTLVNWMVMTTCLIALWGCGNTVGTLRGSLTEDNACSKQRAATASLVNQASLCKTDSDCGTATIPFECDLQVYNRTFPASKLLPTLNIYKNACAPDGTVYHCPCLGTSIHCIAGSCGYWCGT